MCFKLTLKFIKVIPQIIFISIDDIFSQSTSDYKDLKVGDFWDLKYDKKSWDEDGILEESF